jgi:hypothetical protein
LYAYLVSHACYMPRPSYPPRFEYSDNIWWSVNFVKLLILQSSPASRHLFQMFSALLFPFYFNPNCNS